MNRLLLFRRQALPQPLAVRPQRIDRPRASRPPRLGAAASASSARTLPCGTSSSLDGCRREVRMAARDEAPPRQSNDPPAMPGGIEREDRIDHRQAGADQQDVLVTRREVLDCRQRLATPGIVDQASAAVPERQRLGRLVADRQHQSACLDDAPVLEAHGPVRLRLARPRSPAARRGAGDPVAMPSSKYGLQIAPELSPLDEVVAGRRLPLPRAGRNVRDRRARRS